MTLRPALFVAALLIAGSPAGAAEPIAVTPSGRLQGQAAGDVAVFRGVPFAAPPVGALRWRDARPVAPWRGIRQATDFGPACAQIAVGFNDTIAATSSEDCLHLNVWVPAGATPRDRLPVMIYFHGGANRAGSAAGDTKIDPPHDGSILARHGVIVVTANYRLGLFGFLAHPELSAESPHRTSGNYALSDMLTALRWVRTHIRSFGGDPARVTAFGQSAGAWNIGALMTSPQARGLFHRAIVQSNSVFDQGLVDPDLPEAEGRGERIAAYLGAAGDGAISALRKRPAADLLGPLARRPGVRPPPLPDINYDGHYLPRHPALMFRAGQELAIPLLIGSNARDGDFRNKGGRGNPKATAAAADPARPLAGTRPAAPLSDDGRARLREFYGTSALADAAIAHYAGRDVSPDADADIVAATDVDFRCGAAEFARLHGRIAPTWRYEFSHGYEPLGAVHIWDVQYVFGVRSPPADQPRDAALSDAVQRYWTNFAKTGDPNGAGLPQWPRAADGWTMIDFASDGPRTAVRQQPQGCAAFNRRLDEIYSGLKPRR